MKNVVESFMQDDESIQEILPEGKILQKAEVNHDSNVESL